ncbi:MAG: hypothetical protein CMD39_07270 [Gammaproteobacteria bacterium]|nr:hypothetical protein [Gammaproteobacteria bacterium]
MTTSSNRADVGSFYVVDYYTLEVVEELDNIGDAKRRADDLAEESGRRHWALGDRQLTTVRKRRKAFPVDPAPPTELARPTNKRGGRRRSVSLCLTLHDSELELLDGQLRADESRQDCLRRLIRDGAAGD